MSYESMSSDHAFEAFLAGCGVESFTGEEGRMFRFFRSHPGATQMAAVEQAILAYAKGKRK